MFTSSNAGSWVYVGRVPGRIETFDPTGRYVALIQDDGELVVHDVHLGLQTVCRLLLPGETYALALHPSGRSVVRVTRTWWLERWSEGEPPHRVPTLIGTAPAVRLPYGGHVRGAGWLAHTLDGTRLVMGDVTPDEDIQRARVCLLDATTLEVLDEAGPLQMIHPRTVLQDWGEGVIVATGEREVAFATNAGDDVLTFGVVEIIDDSVRIRGATAEESPLVDIVGERVIGLQVDGEWLWLLDSDGYLTKVRWRPSTDRDAVHHPVSVRTFRGLETIPEPLRALAERESEDVYNDPNGPIQLAGDRMLVSVYQDRPADRYRVHGIEAHAIFDANTLQPVGFVDAPKIVGPSAWIELGPEGLLAVPVAGDTWFWQYAQVEAGIVGHG